MPWRAAFAGFLGNHCTSMSLFRASIACGLALPLLEIAAQCSTLVEIENPAAQS